MEKEKIERIYNLKREGDYLKKIVNDPKQPFVFEKFTVSTNSPMHSQIMSVFQNRLKYVESQLEDL